MGVPGLAEGLRFSFAAGQTDVAQEVIVGL